MAETRSQALKDAVREMGETFDSRIENLEGSIAVQNEKIDTRNAKLNKDIAEMFESIRLLSARSGMAFGDDSGKASSPKSHMGSSDRERNRGRTTSGYSGVTRLTKLEFPRFDGSETKEWLFKAEQFFKIDNTPDEFKIGLASIHFDGVAAAWHMSLVESETEEAVLNDWATYKLELHDRFDDLLDDPIAELKQLQETDGIVEYHGRFELIKTRVKLSEEYLVSAYLAGLRTDTQMHIRMFQPQSIRQCLMLGRLYEQAHPKQNNAAVWSNAKTSYGGRGILPFKKGTGTAVVTATATEKPKERQNQARPFLSKEEMTRRRAEGLCYFCDEKYTPGHYLKHKKTQLFMLETDEGEEAEDDNVEAKDEDDAGDHCCAHISVNAVTGITGYQTMRVKGFHGKRALFIVIDSGFTHNFVDAELATKLGCTLSPTTIAKVAVADGRKLGVSSKIEKFKWSFGGIEWEDDMLVLPLGGCDMVLGVQWLGILGQITWDFKKLEIQFRWEQRNILLQGIKRGSVREIKANKLNKIQEEQVQLAMISVQDVTEEGPSELGTVGTVTEETELEPSLQAVLQDFPDVFKEPTSLPPSRSTHDHQIPLLDGSNPINQRPYRYAVHQKNEIDRIDQELLAAGTIRDNSSSFASPVVLVKKKDGHMEALCRLSGA